MAGRAFEGLVNERADFMVDAECRGADIEAFFVGPGEYPWAAVAMCSRCTVRKECLDYAVTNNIEQGIYGGLSPKQRRHHRREWMRR